MSRSGIASRVRRQSFYNALLRIRLQDDRESILRMIAIAWKAAAQADWAWLWLFNTSSRQFELVSIAPESPDSKILPRTRPDPGANSCCMYSCLTGRVVVAPNVLEWAAEIEGERHEVKMARDLVELGARAMVVVPMPNPADGATSELRPKVVAPGRNSQVYSAAISLHYSSAIPTDIVVKHDTSEEDQLDDQMGERSLLLMGSLTSSVIARKRQHDQIRVAGELARLSEMHLTRYQDDPQMVRADFLDAVLELIVRELSVEAASVFLRVPYESRVHCAASTGLMRIDDWRYLTTRRERLEATYEAGEGRTGGVFEEGRPLFLVHEEGSKPKYVEVGRDGKPRPGGTIIYPIQTLSADVSAPLRAAETVGVIRCAYRFGGHFPDCAQAFDEVQLATLRFIVEQVSPTLHTLEARIQREMLISVVKHDLLAPLAALRDAADEIGTSLERGRLPDEYYVLNLREHALRMAHLADLLSRDLSARRPIRLGKLRLLAGLIAPLKRMLTPYASETSDIKIQHHGFEQAPALNVDKVLIERAVYNLVMNAVKYGDRGSTVEIYARSVPGGFAIDVENVGMGITEVEAGKIFRAGYRSPRAVATRLGEGLGLVVVKQIMESHGGRVSLERGSNPTVFRLFFPERLVLNS